MRRQDGMRQVLKSTVVALLGMGNWSQMIRATYSRTGIVWLHSFTATVILVLGAAPYSAFAQQTGLAAYAFAAYCDALIEGKKYGRIAPCAPKEDTALIPWKVVVGPRQVLLTFSEAGSSPTGLSFPASGGSSTYTTTLPAKVIELGTMRMELGESTVTYSGQLERSGDRYSFSVTARERKTTKSNQGDNAGKVVNIDSTELFQISLTLRQSGCKLEAYSRSFVQRHFITYGNYKDFSCKPIAPNTNLKEVFDVFGKMDSILLK